MHFGAIYIWGINGIPVLVSKTFKGANCFSLNRASRGTKSLFCRKDPENLRLCNKWCQRQVSSRVIFSAKSWDETQFSWSKIYFLFSIFHLWNSSIFTKSTDISFAKPPRTIDPVDVTMDAEKYCLWKVPHNFSRIHPNSPLFVSTSPSSRKRSN